MSLDAITHHAVIRFLERHDRFDMSGLRDAFAGDEERILRWLERNEGINVRRIRERMMTPALRTALASGASGVRMGHVRLVIVDGHVVTVRFNAWDHEHFRRRLAPVLSTRARELERAKRHDLITEQMEG